MVQSTPSSRRRLESTSTRSVLGGIMAVADKNFRWLRRHFGLQTSLSNLTGIVRLELYLKRPEAVAALL
jgi:hypothetical protein